MIIQALRQDKYDEDLTRYWVETKERGLTSLEEMLKEHEEVASDDEPSHLSYTKLFTQVWV